MDADQFDQFSRSTADKLQKKKQRKEKQQRSRDNQRIQHQPSSEDQANRSQRPSGVGAKIVSFFGEVAVLLFLVGVVALVGSVLYNVAVPPNSRGCGSYNYEIGVCMDSYEATQDALEAENFRIDEALDHIEERDQQRSGRDLDCSDFPSRRAAQAALNSNPRDPNFLDADHDGIACEPYP